MSSKITKMLDLQSNKTMRGEKKLNDEKTKASLNNNNTTSSSTTGGGGGGGGDKKDDPNREKGDNSHRQSFSNKNNTNTTLTASSQLTNKSYRATVSNGTSMNGFGQRKFTAATGREQEKEQLIQLMQQLLLTGESQIVSVEKEKKERKERTRRRDCLPLCLCCVVNLSVRLLLFAFLVSHSLFFLFSSLLFSTFPSLSSSLLSSPLRSSSSAGVDRSRRWFRQISDCSGL
jgi:hypothetical protein